MINLPLRKTRLPVRFAFIFLLAVGLLTTTGCASLFGVKRPVNVPPLLGPLSDASTTQLFAEVNRVAGVRSIHGKVDIEFQDTSFAETGIIEKYRTAEGSVILQRPGKVYLTINGPFAIDIAQMTSDGEHFRVAVLRGDDKYKRFVRGTNSAVYPTLDVNNKEDGVNKDGKKRSEQRAVSALSNLRPQHLTDALLVRPIEPRAESGFVYAQSEFYQEEPDARPRMAKDARAVRGYYLLDELAPGGDGGVRLARRFWFDRVGGIRLARLQTFDTRGMLVTDVTYGDEKNFGADGNVRLPARVELTRPHDRYKLNLTYQSPDAVVIDREYDPEVFVLQNKWQLPEVDLDARGGQQQGKQ
nr:protein of unknown function (DUF4292) [uncultured bacterium]